MSFIAQYRSRSSVSGLISRLFGYVVLKVKAIRERQSLARIPDDLLHDVIQDAEVFQDEAARRLRIRQLGGLHRR
ncbi:hypothetical protein [Roseibium sp.]|uniref:hypothetical protein n=1 Tax=Roseibium sp. TaxID=1936156 RepID=UPI003A97DDB7